MRVSGLLVLAALIPAPLAAGAALLDAPLVLLNTSPSEPPGFYRRVQGAPAPGTLIAFRPPPAAMDYLRSAQPGRARGSILKAVMAGEGAEVCAGAQLVVEGRRLGPIAERDRAGRPLPRWRGCRRLSAGEWVVFSGRIPNSFDSRYYGPVLDAEILGVYAPIWTWGP
ncbi:S26 family signal peptidase [Caulobacter endophyticus]|uniref:Conjugal transfer protein n=1 Tax=Caulobacter endophyticus TaxID=2172652 RepID=A0A2T9JY24_9CAUL|nr:S26 family signal peptidase [Caulobacter endophyticus]PVM88607.1 conjugal transfer protein [Caulobacter endophyticus]